MSDQFTPRTPDDSPSSPADERSSHRSPLRRTLTAAAAGSVLLLAGCGGQTQQIGDPAAAAGSLAAVCPETIVIQTDWFATPERAPAYNLIGAGGTVDASKGAYIGEIGDTGVQAEIRLGGPYIGGQPVTAQMYSDDSIHLGIVATDVAIRDYEKFPTKAVFTTMQKSPFILMYGPDALPDVTGWDDVAGSDAPVLHAQGMSYVDYLEHEGLVEESQLDGSFDGSPSRFVADSGAILQQGYVSNEPYRWENDVPEWSAPVDYLMLEDAGYHVYQQAYAVRSGQEEEMSGCLDQLVPLLQQSGVDYLEDPEPLNDAFLDISETIQDGPPITAGGNESSVKTQIELGLVDNGPDGAYGSFDPDRVDEVRTTMSEVFAAKGTEVPEMTGDDLATNEYIDPEISR